MPLALLQGPLVSPGLCSCCGFTLAAFPLSLLTEILSFIQMQLKCHLNQGLPLIFPIKRTHSLLSFPTARNLYAIQYMHCVQHSAAFLTLEGYLLLVGYRIQVVDCYCHKKKKKRREEKTRKYQRAWHDFVFSFVYITYMCVYVLGHNTK